MAKKEAKPKSYGLCVDVADTPVVGSLEWLKQRIECENIELVVTYTDGGSVIVPGIYLSSDDASVCLAKYDKYGIPPGFANWRFIVRENYTELCSAFGAVLTDRSINFLEQMAMKLAYSLSLEICGFDDIELSYKR